MPNSAYKPAPNRFASEQEAAILVAQIATYEADRAIAIQRVEEANACRRTADALVRAAEMELMAAREAQQTAELGFLRSRARVDALDRDISAARALLHPVRKVPPEVLGLIFEELCDALHANAARLLTGFLDIQRAPFVLASVCRSWREVAIASTKIWSRIIFTFPYKSLTPSRLGAWSVFLAAGLKRSGTRLLELTIVHDEGHQQCSQMGPIFRQLLSALSRSVVVRVTFHSDACEHFQEFMRSPAPKLQSARMATFLPAAPTTPLTFDFFTSAHKLSTLELVHCLPKWRSAALHNVTTLQASWTVVTVQDLVDMFVCMPKLEDITIDVASFVDNGGVVIAPSVRRFNLSIGVVSDRIANNGFQLPALQSMTLRFPRYNTMFPQRNIPTTRRLAFMVSPSYNIRHLRMDFTKCDERFAQELTLLERLQTLTTRNAWLVPAFFSRLMPANAGFVVCPVLREMNFDACNLENDFEPDTLFDFMRSRSEPDSGASPTTVRIRVVGDTLVPAWLKESALIQS